MRKLLVFAASLYTFLAAPVHASTIDNSAELVVCPQDKAVFDIQDSERLPFATAGATHVLKLPTGTKSLAIEEKKRQARVVDEFATIVKAVTDGVFKSLKATEALCAKYVQKYKRSTITVTAFDADRKELAKRSLVAGPAEHLYLSADMPISNIKQLTLDASTNTVIEKEKPASFYLGINWKYGDVFEDYSGKDFYKNFSIKLLLKASSRPSESYGLGIGYSFDFVDVFAARIRTKADANVGGASLGNSDATVFGVSFNISKGLDWLKK